MKLFKTKHSQLYVMKHKIRQLIKDLKDCDETQWNKNLICLRLRQILDGSE